MRLKASRITLALISIAAALCTIACDSAATQEAAENAADAALTAGVTSKLAVDPKVNAYEIDVDTDDAVVALRGTVLTEDERIRAEELARTTAGVARVKNRIVVEEHASGDGESGESPSRGPEKHR